HRRSCARGGNPSGRWRCLGIVTRDRAAAALAIATRRSNQKLIGQSISVRPMDDAHSPGTVELDEDVDPELKKKLEATRMSAEERFEYAANSMWGMYNFTALRALMLAGGDWDKANEICEEVEKIM